MKLEDIARQAGVSRSTVSRVINGERYVSAETRHKVMRIIEAEGFTPNPAARALVTQRTSVIGVVIPHPLQDVFSADDPHYFSTIIQGISDQTQQRDYATLLWLGNSNEEASRFYRRVLQYRMMDGLVIIASIDGEEMLVENLLENNIPFVMIGRPLHVPTAINYVSIDNVNAAQQAIKHLFSQGKTRIATITGDIENADGLDRLQGYRHALQNLGLPVNENLIAKGRFSREWGYRCMKQLLTQDVDAVFAANDSIALGALEAIAEAGLSVPEDIAVVGFDDLPLAGQTSPGLTTIRQPIYDKAARASELLLDLLEDKTPSPTQILMPTQLVIRHSCGAQSGVKQ